MGFAFAGQYGAEQVITTAGVPLASTAVSVYPHGSGTLATLYTDRTMATVASNPVSTDTSGNLTFFAEPGLYDLTVAGMTSRETVLVPLDPGELGSFPRQRGAWASGVAYAVNDQVTEAGATWDCIIPHTSGSTFTTTNWSLVGHVSLTQTITSSQNVTAPIWATVADVTCMAGGGGAGGAGSALTSGGVTNQGGSGGGGGGESARQLVAVTGGTQYTVGVGAGGVGGAGGAVNGNAGSAGTNGGNSRFAALSSYNGYVIAAGGGPGLAGAANSATQGEGGSYAANSLNSTGQGLPGSGSASNLYAEGGINGAYGGAGGGPANSTNGGMGGLAAQTIRVDGGELEPGSVVGYSTTANGGNGETATAYGCGGAGAGGGAPGGTGGNGGNGGPGVVFIEWRSA